MASTYKTTRIPFGAQGPSTITDDNQASGASTPPLWKANNYGSLSPTSRSQVIARGQKELMDMVSMMPEGCYELSLRDIVEVQQHQKQQTITPHKRNKRIDQQKKWVISKHCGVNNQGGGLLLKMVLPVSWGGSKKKKKSDNSVTSSNSISNCGRDGRVSPKPLLSEGSMKSSNGGGDKDWWIGRRFSECEESESSGGFSSSVHSGSSKSSGTDSTNSRCSSSNSNNIRHRNGGCWSFMFNRKDRGNAI